MELAVLFLLAALVLGRWWMVVVPALLVGAVVFWFSVYLGTDGELYGSGEQDPGFWVLCTMVSWAAALIGVGVHQAVIGGVRLLLGRP